MTRRFLFGFVALALTVPAVALAAGRTVAPTAAQRAAILRAFGSRSRAQSNCMTVLLAASNHRYATVRPHTNRACRKYAFNGKNVFKNTTDNHWKRVFAASDYTCPLPRIPRQVQRDFAICK